MSKEKQIEEMTKITCQMFCREKEKKCAGVQQCDMKCLHYQRCEALYNAGYRKQSEGEWVDNYNGTFTCTVCGGRASKMNYCGRCGAKMKGGEADA